MNDLFKQYKTVVGIDPDITASGVAFVDMETRSIRTCCMCFPVLVEELAKLDKDTTLIVVEAAYLTGAKVFHIGKDANVYVASKMGYHVGQNHEVARLLVECLKYAGMDVKELTPLRKAWKGQNRKISHDEFVQITQCQQKRTNQEERDAGLIAWFEAGLPIVIKRNDDDRERRLPTNRRAYKSRARSATGHYCSEIPL